MRVSNEVYFSRQRVSFFSFNSFFFLCKKYRYLSMGDEVERTSPFQIYYIHLRVGGRGEKTPSFDLFFRLRSRAATTRRCALTSKLVLMHQTPHLCEFRLAVEFSLAIYFIIAHLNRPVARFCISLSSGIRMFARGSETRGVCTNHFFHFRARSRIPNHK